MSSYRTDKTSRIILALFIAYALAYGIARNKALRLVNLSETNGRRQFIQPTDASSDNSWAAAVFWPAIKLEEIIRGIGQSI